VHGKHYILAKYLSIQKLQVLGDSSVIINWLNKKGNLVVNALEGWKQRIIILKGKFVETNFYHIFCNFNMATDEQSKRALSEPEGYIVLHKWSDGMRVLETSSIFIDDEFYLYLSPLISLCFLFYYLSGSLLQDWYQS
jgi:hypothetical protein